MRPLLLAVAIVAAVSLLSCKPKPNTIVPDGVTPSAQWVALNLPESSIPIPAVFVGRQRQLSGDCFTSVAADTTNSAADLSKRIVQESSMADSLKAAFKKALTDANVEATLTQALTSTVTIDVHRARIVKVDPVRALPDFTKPTCRVQGLDWFSNRRAVVTGGLLVDSLSMVVGDSLTAAQRAALDVAVSAINASLRVAFNHATSATGHLSLTANNAFFATLTTPLVMDSCQTALTVGVGPGQTQTADLCSGQFKAMLTPSAAPGRLTVAVIVPGEGAGTGDVDVKIPSAGTFALGPNRLVSITALPAANAAVGAQVSLKVLTVGVSGKE